MAEFIVNTARPGLQHQPAIATLGGSHFVVVWNDNGDFSIKGRLVQADGRSTGDELVVSGGGANTQRQFPVACSTGSGPVAAWIESAINPPGPRPHVKMRRFGRDGQLLGEELQVSTNDVDPTQRPALASMIDGGFVVVWADARRDRRIRAQRFGPEGNRTGDEFTINTTEGFHEKPAAVRLVDGNYVVSWRSDPVPPGGGALMFRSFDVEGTPVLPETRPNLS